MPGTVVTTFEGATQTLDRPSYLFLVDLEPNNLWTHPAISVVIAAEVDAQDPVMETATEHPTRINDSPFDFGPGCGANPNRVFGSGFRCEPIPVFSLQDTDNSDDWAVIITGRVIQSVDSVTMGHDIKKAGDRINSGQYGPMVDKDNIEVVRGANNRGPTKQEVCDVLDSLKGKACRKLIIKYIGHGTKDGMVLKKDGENKSETLSWEEFAGKVKDIGAGEVCIDITACHSGAAVKPLQDSGVRGSVITSSNSGNKTPQGEGSGTYWEEALKECSESEFADTDMDGHVHQKEAARWVYVRKGTNDPATRPKPQIVCLNDSIRRQRTTTRNIRHGSWRMSGPSGSLEVYVQRVCVKTRYQGASKDSTVYRSNVYVKNASSTNRQAGRPYQIVAICGRGRNREQRVLTTIQPRVNARSEVCVATLPNDCRGMIVREVPRGQVWRGIVLEGDSAQLIDASGVVSVITPGSYFRVEHTFVDPDVGERYTATTSGPDDWDVGQDPQQFSTIGDSTAMVDVWGWVPADSADGGDLTTILIDDTTYAETQLGTRILVPYETTDNAAMIDAGHHRLYSVRSGTPEVSWMQSTRIELDSGLVVRFGDTVHLEDATIVSTTVSGGPLLLNPDAPAVLHDVVIAGVSTLGILYSDISIDHLALSDASLTLQQSLSATPVILRGISLFGTRGNVALTISNQSTSPVYLERLLVEGADGLQVSTTGQPGVVRCLDCEVDPEQLAPTFGGTIALDQSISAVVVDGNGDPRMGATLHVLAANGDTLATMTTDADGYAGDTVEVANVTDVVVDRTPITVRLVRANNSVDDGVIRDFVWQQLLFTDTTTSVGVTEIERSKATVAPHPIPMGRDARLIDPNGIFEVTLLDQQARSLAVFTGHGESQVALTTSSLAAGMYYCRYRTATDVRFIPIIIN